MTNPIGSRYRLLRSVVPGVGLAFAAAIFLLAIFLSRRQSAFFEAAYAGEDGIIEWLTVVVLIAAVALCLLRALRHWRDAAAPRRIFTLGLMGLLLFVAGEEISWGQRLLGFSTPQFFVEHNAQVETNVHNFVVRGVKINRALFSRARDAITLVFFLVLPVAHALLAGVRRAIDRWGVPVPKWHYSVAILPLLLWLDLIDSGRRWEVHEFLLSYVFFLAIWHPSNPEAVGGGFLTHSP